MARRTINITINNNTGSTLNLGNVDREHGTDPQCTQQIADKASGTITAEDSKNYGPVATVQYKVSSTGGIYTIAYNKPMTSNPTTVKVTPPSGFGYQCQSSNLQQKHSSCTYSFTDGSSSGGNSECTQ